MPLWALAPEEPPPSRVVNVPIHNSCTAEAMHPPLDGSLMFLRGAVGSATIRILRVTPFPLSWPVCDVRCARLYFRAVLGSIAVYTQAYVCLNAPS